MAAILTVSFIHPVQSPAIDHTKGIKSDHYIAGERGITLDRTGDVVSVTGPGGTFKAPLSNVIEWTE